MSESNKIKKCLYKDSNIQELNTSSSSENDSVNKPLMIIGPSGVGKDTIISKLKKKYPNLIIKCVSNTTRAKRDGEIEGINYYYISKEKFAELESKNELFGKFKNYDNCYGVSKTVLNNTLTNNKIVYFDLNIETAEKISKDGDLDFNYIAFLPPNISELKNRLLNRNTENAENLQKRLDYASIEIEKIKNADFLNYKIVNKNVEETFKKFEKYVKDLYPKLFH